MKIFFLLLVAVLVIGTIYFFSNPDRFYSHFFGDPDLGRTDFSTIKSGGKPNRALACPQDFCPNREPDIVSPVYDLPVFELRDKFREALKKEHRLERVHANDAALRERYLSRSKVMRFPDTIQVEFVPISTKQSSIALFAHAQIGTTDFGANRQRVERWLRYLEPWVAQSK